MEFGGEDVDRARVDWPAGLSETMDRANLAYREGRYDEAADLFREAADAHPDIGSAWFGLYMAEHARGNMQAADSALARAESLTPGLNRSHAEAMREGMGGMPPTGQGMPPGHPQLPSADSPADDADAPTDADSPRTAPPLPSGH